MYNKIIASFPSYSISAIALYIVYIHQIDTILWSLYCIIFLHFSVLQSVFSELQYRYSNYRLLEYPSMLKLYTLPLSSIHSRIAHLLMNISIKSFRNCLTNNSRER